MQYLTTENLNDYELIDSGRGTKLERICGVLVERPAPQAIWPSKKSESDWKKAQSRCIRQKDGGGHWEHLKGEPKGLVLKWNTSEQKMLQFKLKFTSFGHCGVFFEQIPVWNLLVNEAIRLQKELNRPVKFLNLFGYTGCATLAVASTGADCFHVDSAKGVLNWGQENAELSGLDLKKIKFVHEDARMFLKHSIRKGFKYDIILADPPSWGHGVKKEKWEFEDDMIDFVQDCYKVLSRENSSFFLSSHTHGVQQLALKNLLASNTNKQKIEVGELGVKHSQDERILPAGIFAFGHHIN